MTAVSWSLTAADVNSALGSIDLRDAQEPFRPQFSCKQTHRTVWNEWFSDWEQRLIPFLEHLVEEHTDITFSDDELEARLQEYIIESACRRVAFDPTLAVIEWLRADPFGGALPEEDIPAPGELEDRLIDFTRFLTGLISHLLYWRFHPIRVQTQYSIHWARLLVLRARL